jgi:hypothetical protein
VATQTALVVPLHAATVVSPTLMLPALASVALSVLTAGLDQEPTEATVELAFGVGGLGAPWPGGGGFAGDLEGLWASSPLLAYFEAAPSSPARSSSA